MNLEKKKKKYEHNKQFEILFERLSRLVLVNLMIFSSNFYNGVSKCAKCQSDGELILLLLSPSVLDLGLWVLNNISR